ncbi:MAG: InlB B-repeat-containing protein [Clostridia bacterium]|nr:InlB B-repeat-containing protein [Clostridia bacterium]
MKRIIALFLSLLMLVSLVPSAFAAGFNDTTISFSLTSEGKNTIYVPTGTEITVNFSLVNKTSEGASFTVESIYNDIKIDNNFFEIDESKIESSMLAYAHFQADSKRNKWARFNGEHATLPGGLRTYTDGEVVGTFKLTVKATSGQSTISTTTPSLYDDGYVSYHITTENLTVIVGEEPPVLHTVNYMSENELVGTSQNAAGTITVGAAPNNGPANHTFKGWMNNGTLYQPGDSFELTDNTTFTAKWERIIPNYTLTFETNGGTAVDAVTSPEGTNVDLTSKTTSRTGYTFDGWCSDAELNNKVTQITLNGNTTVYAKWNETPKPTYTLTFNTNGGSAVAPVTKEEGSTVTLSGYTTSKSGYTFAGWYLDAELTRNVTLITLNANTTVYAKWTLTQSGGITGGGTGGSSFTLTLKNADGTIIDRIEKSADTEIELDKLEFSKEGYVLEGWYKDKEFTDKVTTVKLNKSITLYAKWVKKDVTPSKPDYKPSILTDEHYAYIIGRDGGMIAPENDITRAEVATIIYRLLDEDVRNKAKTEENTFTDVNQDDWFNTAVSTLAGLDLVKGRTTDSFAPDAFITRAELATIFARMVEVEYDGKVLFSDVSDHWAESYINEAGTAEWIVGYNGLFRPDDNITRAEVMTLVNRVLNREPESKDDLLDGMTTWKDNADESAWYYLAIQEATNSHSYEIKADGIHEKWTALKENPDWTE